MSLYESLVSNIGIGMPVINKKTFIEWLTERNSNLEDVFKRWWFSGQIRSFKHKVMTSTTVTCRYLIAMCQ